MRNAEKLNVLDNVDSFSLLKFRRIDWKSMKHYREDSKFSRNSQKFGGKIHQEEISNNFMKAPPPLPNKIQEKYRRSIQMLQSSQI